jgi:perosamine synthetase
MPFFPVSQPSIGERELAYVSDAVASGWVSSIGRYIEQFESMFAAFCGTKHALAVSNGTTALHLALVTAGVKCGDEVIIPDLTFVATANAATYIGAKVVAIDIDPATLCMDPDALARAITPRTKAIIPVHLYGHPADMNAILDVANAHGVSLIEDCAEAHGAVYRGRKVGSFGKMGVFSFYGNKVITSGEGGIITTDDSEAYARACLLRDHAMSRTKRYWHTEVGFNYRMTNMQAALAVAQMERIESFLAKRREIMGWYREELAGLTGIALNRESPGCTNVFWMICLEVERLTIASRDSFMQLLRADGVDSRPYFYPVSDMPMYGDSSTPVAHRIFERGINLPSYTDLSREDVAEIGRVVRKSLVELSLT